VKKVVSYYNQKKIERFKKIKNILILYIESNTLSPQKSILTAKWYFGSIDLLMDDTALLIYHKEVVIIFREELKHLANA
jgi:hypothetical protein